MGFKPSGDMVAVTFCRDYSAGSLEGGEVRAQRQEAVSAACCGRRCGEIQEEPSASLWE